MTKKITATIDDVRIKKVLFYREQSNPVIKVSYELLKDDGALWEEGLIFFVSWDDNGTDPDGDPIPLDPNQIRMSKKQENRMRQLYKQLRDRLGNMLLDEENEVEE